MLVPLPSVILDLHQRCGYQLKSAISKRDLQELILTLSR